MPLAGVFIAWTAILFVAFYICTFQRTVRRNRTIEKNKLGYKIPIQDNSLIDGQPNHIELDSCTRFMV